MGKPEGKRPLGRHRRGCENDIKIYLQEVGYGVVDWIKLLLDRDSCEYGIETSGSIKCEEFLD
jgi:hypothetical protein